MVKFLRRVTARFSQPPLRSTNGDALQIDSREYSQGRSFSTSLLYSLVSKPLISPPPGFYVEDCWHQMQSPIFRLPLEIREQIYLLVLGNRQIHLNIGPPSEFGIGAVTVWHTRAFCGSSSVDWNDFERISQSHIPGLLSRLSASADPSPGPDVDLFSLPLTCGRLYTESMKVFYSFNSFHISLILLTNVPSNLAAFLSPARFEAVRKLDAQVMLSFGNGITGVKNMPESWAFFWTDLGTVFSGLKELRVYVTVQYEDDRRRFRSERQREDANSLLHPRYFLALTDPLRELALRLTKLDVFLSIDKRWIREIGAMKSSQACRWWPLITEESSTA